MLGRYGDERVQAVVHLRVAEREAQPLASNLNVVPGQTVANGGVQARLGGSAGLASPINSCDLVADVLDFGD